MKSQQKNVRNALIITMIIMAPMVASLLSQSITLTGLLAILREFEPMSRPRRWERLAWIWLRAVAPDLSKHNPPYFTPTYIYPTYTDLGPPSNIVRGDSPPPNAFASIACRRGLFRTFQISRPPTQMIKAYRKQL